MKVSVHRSAERELDEATEYYFISEQGVERQFVIAIETAVDDIRRFPLASPIEIGDIHRKVVKTFPYSIYYRKTNSLIRILAVAHQSREPYYWIDRN